MHPQTIKNLWGPKGRGTPEGEKNENRGIDTGTFWGEKKKRWG